MPFVGGIGAASERETAGSKAYEKQWIISLLYFIFWTIFYFIYSNTFFFVARLVWWICVTGGCCRLAYLHKFTDFRPFSWWTFYVLRHTHILLHSLRLWFLLACFIVAASGNYVGGGWREEGEETKIIFVFRLAAAAEGTSLICEEVYTEKDV